MVCKGDLITKCSFILNFRNRRIKLLLNSYNVFTFYLYTLQLIIKDIYKKNKYGLFFNSTYNTFYSTYYFLLANKLLE